MLTFNKEADVTFLQQITASDSDAMHVVIDDSAEFHHRNSACELPANLRVTTLPAYSLELNPAKKFCDIVKAKICNIAWQILETLEDKMTVMICIYWDDANRVMSLLTKSCLSSEIYDLKKPVSRSFKLNGII